MSPISFDDSGPQYDARFSRFLLAPGVLTPLVPALEPLSKSRGLFGACTQKLLIKTVTGEQFMKVRPHLLHHCLFILTVVMTHDDHVSPFYLCVCLRSRV